MGLIKFRQLSHDGQVALAAWAVLAVSEPIVDYELSVRDLPAKYNCAIGDICKQVGLRGRRRHNNERSHHSAGAGKYVLPKRDKKRFRPLCKVCGEQQPREGRAPSHVDSVTGVVCLGVGLVSLLRYGNPNLRTREVSDRDWVAVSRRECSPKVDVVSGGLPGTSR